MQNTGLVGDDETSWREALEHETPTGVLSSSSFEQPNNLDSNEEDINIELKPCPKCKSRAALQRDRDTRGKEVWRVHCTKKECHYEPDGCFLSAKDAAAWWDELCQYEKGLSEILKKFK